jgi:peroxiredoxin
MQKAEDDMAIKAGDRIPAGKLKVMTRDGSANVDAEELLGKGRVVLFSVPGAFTPTCDAKHLPGFVENAAALARKGVGRIVCLAVNDVFVMNAWGKSAGVGEAITMAADGNGDYTRALGLELDARGFGMGMRGQRFALVIEDGVVRQVHVEAPGEFKVSSAEHILQALG